jgi:hypothetical protein
VAIVSHPLGLFGTRGIRRPDGPGGDYRFSHVTLTAPEGKYSWVNQSVYVGTLHSLRPRPAVLIRVYRVY